MDLIKTNAHRFPCGKSKNKNGLLLFDHMCGFFLNKDFLHVYQILTPPGKVDEGEPGTDQTGSEWPSRTARTGLLLLQPERQGEFLRPQRNPLLPEGKQ